MVHLLVHPAHPVLRLLCLVLRLLYLVLRLLYLVLRLLLYLQHLELPCPLQRRLLAAQQVVLD